MTALEGLKPEKVFMNVLADISGFCMLQHFVLYIEKIEIKEDTKL